MGAKLVEIKVEVQNKKFNKFLQRFIRNLSSPKVGAALLKITFDMLKKIIERSPVDTGRFRAAWYPAMEAMAGKGGFALPPLPEGTGGTEGRKKGKIEMSLDGLVKTITITNSLDYAMALEYGHSKQAPLGMVRVTMMQLQRRAPVEVMNALQAMWDRDGVPKWSDWYATGAGVSAVRA